MEALEGRKGRRLHELALADINTPLCKRYLAERGKQAATWRELEDLREHHHLTIVGPTELVT